MTNHQEFHFPGTGKNVCRLTVRDIVTHYAVATEFSGNATAQKWRLALDQIQKQHPALSNGKIDNNASNTCHNSFNESRIPLRIAYACRNEDWQEELQNEMQCLGQNEYPAPCRAVIIQQPGRTVFILMLNYQTGQGAYGPMLIDQILTMICEPDERIASIFEAASKGLALTPIKSHQNLVNSPSEAGLSSKAGVAVNRLQLSWSLTKTLSERCREEKITLRSAITAAFMLGLKYLDESLGQNPVRILHPFSAKHQPGFQRRHNLFVSFKLAPCVSRGQTFWDLAKRIGKLQDAAQSAEWINNYISDFRSLFYNIIHVNICRETPQEDSTQELLFTEQGLAMVQQQYGSFKVKALWGPFLAANQPCSHTIGITTHNDKLHLTLAGLKPFDELLDAAELVLIAACYQKDSDLLRKLLH